MCASISARSTLYVGSITNIGGELAPIVRQGERLRRGVEPGRGGRRWLPRIKLGTPNSAFEPDGPRQRVPKDECGRLGGVGAITGASGGRSDNILRMHPPT